MRIDKYLAERFGSRTRAAQAISQGLVLVNGAKTAPSREVGPDDRITFTEPEESFVSNGGYKLSKALKDFDLSVAGGVFADVGASNGGFTDCLFQSGAKKVYCIDVGENQLDASLHSKNIVVIDNFNARNMSAAMFDEILDGVVIDVSFISLTHVLDKAAEALDDKKVVIALIKPQFECDGGRVGKRGVVKDAATHRRAIAKIYDFACGCNLAPRRLTTAPIKAGKNKEYLALFIKNGTPVALHELLKYAKL